MRSEPREDRPSVNVVTWSNITTGEDKAIGKQPEENLWVHKATDKDTKFDLHKEKETLMEVKKSFVDSWASTSTNQNAQTEKPEEVITAQETDPSVLKSFLQTCMKLLRDQKIVEGL